MTPPWFVGTIAWGDDSFPSGPAIDTGLTPDDLFGLGAYHDSLFGYVHDSTDALLYSVDPSDLTIATHGGDSFPAATAPISTFSGRVSLTDTVSVVATAALGTAPGTTAFGFNVIERSGTSISIGAFNRPVELDSIDPFSEGCFEQCLTRIDDTHFAFAWYRIGAFSPYDGSWVSICSVSGTTVTIDVSSDMSPAVGPVSIIGLLDSTHFLLLDESTGFDLFALAFTTGGGLSGSAGPFSLTGAPGDLITPYFGICKADLSGDFLLHEYATSGSYIQPCTWNGSSIDFGTPTLIASQNYGSSGVGIDIAGRSQRNTTTPFLGATDMGGTLDRHIFVGLGADEDEFFGQCAEQSGTTLTLEQEFRHFRTNANKPLIGAVEPTLHSENITVLGLEDSTAWLQAAQC